MTPFAAGPSRRLLALAAGLVAAAGLITAVDAPGARADPAPRAPQAVRAYVAARSTCTQPSSPTAFRCFAEKLVPVAKGAPGAMPAATAPAAAHGPDGGLSPGDLERFYGFNRNGGSGQTVAIVIWGHNPDVATDLFTFEHHYSMPRETASSFRVVNQNGRTSPLPSTNNALTGTHGETDLDVQSVRAVCAKCKILLVEASVDSHGQPSDYNLATAVRTAVRMGATVISNSWGGPENQVKASSSYATAFRQPGVVITAATGDAGWYGWDYAATGDGGDGAPSFPATSPYVVSVGGTSIRANANGTRASESVWNDDGGSADDLVGGATGSGCSTRFYVPSWQRATPGYSYAGCGNHRLSADVSVDANPATGVSIYSRTEGGWGRYGGTSLSSPIVGAMYALAGGAGGSSFPAASLYVNVYKAGHPTARYDVTSGGNAFCGADSTETCGQNVRLRTLTHNNPNAIYGSVVDCSFPHSGANVSTYPYRNRSCNAAGGLDGPTGIGTPRGLTMFRNTAPYAAVSGTRTPKAKHSGTYYATLSPKNGARITSINWYFGDGRHSSAAKVTHSWSSKGRYLVGYVAVDSYGQVVERRMYVTVS